MLGRYYKNKDGNFSIILALCLATLLTVIAVAIDWISLTQSRQKLADISDGAVLAGAAHADARRKERIEFVQAYIDQHADDLGAFELIGAPIIVFNDVTDRVSVTLRGRQSLMFGRLLGKSDSDVMATSQANYATDQVDPISLVFALDVSGSMADLTTDGRVKLQALKESVPALFEGIEAGVRNKRLTEEATRTGVGSYNTVLTESTDMAKGWNHAETHANAMVAGGGTNSTPALQFAYDQLRADRTYRAGQGENVSRLKQFLVFMTDGNNNQMIWDEETRNLCQDMKSDGIVIFAIAFAAPEKGEALLLECASDNNQATAGAPSVPPLVGAPPILSPGEKNDVMKAKSARYFDADDAKKMKRAFKAIGQEIASTTIRLM